MTHSSYRSKGHTSLLVLSIVVWVLFMAWSMVELCLLDLRQDGLQSAALERRELLEGALHQAFIGDWDLGPPIKNWNGERLRLNSDQHDGQIIVSRSVHMSFLSREHWVSPKGVLVRAGNQSLLVVDYVK